MPRDYKHGQQGSCAVCSGMFAQKNSRHKFCSSKCKGQWKYINKHVTTEYQYKKISGNWGRYMCRLMYYGGRKRDQLSKEIILAQLEKQNYKCALSGVELTCTLERGVVTPTNASIDRIQAGGSYAADNIQMVCKALNSWRSDTSVDDFVGWCRAVVNFQDQKGKI